MVMHGTYKQGAFVPDEAVDMKEGQRVLMTVAPEPTEGESTTQKLLEIAGAFRSGRKDGSVNHDHYIYGTPKRESQS